MNMNKETLRMQMLAGIITESQYKEYTLILEDENIDEGIKSWLIGGLIALTTIAGVGKGYQMNQKYQADEAAQTEYYNDVLSKELSKVKDENLSRLGLDINEKTRDISMAREFSPEESNKVFSDYAKKYMQQNPNEFSVGANGGIYWTGK